MGRKTVQILTTAPLPYFMISVNAIWFEKVSLSGMENLTTVC